MSMRRLIISIIFLMTMQIAVAESYSFRDVDTASPIKDALIFLTNSEIITEYIDGTGVLQFVPEQDVSYTFLIDYIDTPGFDYVGTLVKQQQNNAFPVGSLVGIVKDKNNNVVDRASLQFTCQAYNIPLSYPLTTDDYGSFVVEAIPLNTCRIYAASSGYVGFTDVTMEKGAKQDVEIVLDQKRATSTPSTTLSMILVIILTLLAVLGYKLLSEKRKQQKEDKKGIKKETKEKIEKEVDEQSQEKTNNRLEQILPTLNNREAAIVNFLITANNHETNQAVIRHNTSIPRTSLARTVTVLQQKNIVEIRTVGKVVKVKLTKWVLEKD